MDMRLCPFGTAGDEPLDLIEGFHMGVREAVWRGYVTLERGRSVYPNGDWSVIEEPTAPTDVDAS